MYDLYPQSCFVVQEGCLSHLCMIVPVLRPMLQVRRKEEEGRRNLSSLILSLVLQTGLLEIIHLPSHWVEICHLVTSSQKKTEKCNLLVWGVTCPVKSQSSALKKNIKGKQFPVCCRWLFRFPVERQKIEVLITSSNSLTYFTPKNINDK